MQEISLGSTRFSRKGTNSLSLVQHQKLTRQRRVAWLQKVLIQLPKRKKSSATPGNIFRSSTLDRLLDDSQVKEECNAYEKSQLSLNTQQHSAQNDMEVNYGIHQMTAQKFNNEAAFVFPENRAPFLNCVLNGTVMFKGNSTLDDKDLQSLYGRKAQDSDNYLTNFVIEAHLHLIPTKGMATGTKVEILEWELFEKGFRNGSTQESLKGKAPLMEWDIIRVPCNRGQSTKGEATKQELSLLVPDKTSPSLCHFGSEQYHLRVALGADGPPFGKDDEATSWLVSFLNVEIVEDTNEEIMIENDKATQTRVSKYDLAGQIANRVERIPLQNQMSVSSEHVRTLNPRKAGGPDGINNWLLRDYADFLTSLVCNILNAIFAEQKLPRSWKDANVTPLIKVEQEPDIDADKEYGLIDNMIVIKGRLYVRLNVAQETPVTSDDEIEGSDQHESTESQSSVQAVNNQPNVLGVSSGSMQVGAIDEVECYSSPQWSYQSVDSSFIDNGLESLSSIFTSASRETMSDSLLTYQDIGLPSDALSESTMKKEARDDSVHQILNGLKLSMKPYMCSEKLKVDREDIIMDFFQFDISVHFDPAIPIKVQSKGEPAVDTGGLLRQAFTDVFTELASGSS
ncbi:hypothetical protein AWC38_SpisGene11949 [Stylophora pistillata]|uniref:HECT domain-containing protein n=1 Tax=Stylophora pistillata TaxID=50429 RepID=A0A2B4S407_STYPI|nr:hypothetical protein AWC38_SpisGene11949 [Stylophora pistillata]